VCGIAGYGLGSRSTVDRTLAAQILLAGIADRGSDATGYAYRGAGVELAVEKRRSGASGLIDSIAIPQAATQALLHVRDFTKGHPSLHANNHPIRHGAVVGVHNGVIDNDDEVLARHRIDRAEPGMTVDSEAIFALVDRYGHLDGEVFEELHGAMATGWLQVDEPDLLFLARGIGRPLWIGAGESELLFASTRQTLRLAEEYLGLRLRVEEVPEGALLEIADGTVLRQHRFEPDRSFRRKAPPAVRAPQERASCLELLEAAAARA
jgi:glucosamine 6-phosphate synthetase-like amidotransferase/phosphosugar isomerase protein